MANTDVTQKLLQLKEHISKAEKEEASIKGMLEQVLSQLKKEFEIDTIDDAEQLEASLQKKIEELEKDVEQKLKLIENEIGKYQN